MKLVSILTVLFSFLLVSQTSFGQEMTKAEKKKLKKEIKTYKKDPASYKKMLTRNNTTIREQAEEIEELKEELATKNAIIGDMNDSLASLKRKYANSLSTPKGLEVPKGTVYAVQIGYFKELDLKRFNVEPKMAKAEIVDGAKRYVIGYFTSPEDALNFRADIKELGIDDAFVSQYINGERNMKYDAMK